VALPLAGAYEVQAPHAALEKTLAAEPAVPCAPVFADAYCGSFALPDGSELVAQFETNDGQLHRATWSTLASLQRIRVLPSATPPA